MERLPGFREFYPEPLPHADAWSADLRGHLFATWRAVAHRYGFREYDGPPLEPLELYTAKSGDEIVAQLYHFTDKGGREVTLRPEMTPTLARMVAAHARNYKKPITWFALPQLFRYERQQKGRLREHFQFNADIFGEVDPAADAELIALLIDSLRALGLTAEDFVVRLSSRHAWREFFQRRGTGGAAQENTFYQLVDKLERTDPAETDRQLQALGFSLAAVQDFIRAARPTAELEVMLANLAARGLADFVRVDYGVIRGLAYYTGPVFEAFDRQGSFRAIAGGGRYDGLVKLISGGKVDLPGLGFGMGDVVLGELLRQRGRLPRFDARLDVFGLIEDEGLRARSLGLIQALRQAGYAVDYSLVPAKVDRQFKRALELQTLCTAKLEQGVSGELAIRVRHLATREERLLSPPDPVALARWIDTWRKTASGPPA
jgi:histidyl-tRNA synthetase